MNVNYKPIETQLYHAITEFYTASGSTNVTYKIGTFVKQPESEELYFEELLQKNFWIDNENTERLNNQPLTKEDIGKTPNEIMLSRIEAYLRSTGELRL